MIASHFLFSFYHGVVFLFSCWWVGQKCVVGSWLLDRQMCISFSFLIATGKSENLGNSEDNNLGASFGKAGLVLCVFDCESN